MQGCSGVGGGGDTSETGRRSPPALGTASRAPGAKKEKKKKNRCLSCPSRNLSLLRRDTPRQVGHRHLPWNARGACVHSCLGKEMGWSVGILGQSLCKEPRGGRLPAGAGSRAGGRGARPGRAAPASRPAPGSTQWNTLPLVSPLLQCFRLGFVFVLFCFQCEDLRLSVDFCPPPNTAARALPEASPPVPFLHHV